MSTLDVIYVYSCMDNYVSLSIDVGVHCCPSVSETLSKLITTAHAGKNLFIYLLRHIYPGVPHQCATLFSLGLRHYIHDNNKHPSVYIQL